MGAHLVSWKSYRSSLSLAIALLGLLGGVSANAAPHAHVRDPGRHARTSWSATTHGLPASTVVGEWKTSRRLRSVRLDFVGAHVAGGDTMFEARWVTPYTTASTSFVATWDVDAAGTTPIELVEATRVRREEGDWSRWRATARRFGPGYQSTHETVLSRGLGAARVQFEWKLVGRMFSATGVRGRISLSID